VQKVGRCWQKGRNDPFTPHYSISSALCTRNTIDITSPTRALVMRGLIIQ
jgi:hypothetical protein